MQTLHPSAEADLDVFAGLADLTPAKRTGGGLGRPPTFAPHEIHAIYAARKRGVTWKQINDALGDRALARPGTLGSSVHSSARRHGIEPQVTARKTAE